LFYPVSALIAVAVCLSPGCGKTTPAQARQAEVRAILTAHLQHENALLDILEQHGDDPTRTDALMRAYVVEHGAAMRLLGEKRRLLEADPTALARAMRELEPELTRVFERRRALTAAAPALMARPEVRTALAALDEL